MTITMNVKKMKEGAEVAAKQVLTDDELELALASASLALAYSRARGISFSMMTRQLQEDVEMYERYAENRGWTAKRIRKLTH